MAKSRSDEFLNKSVTERNVRTCASYCTGCVAVHACIVLVRCHVMFFHANDSLLATCAAQAAIDDFGQSIAKRELKINRLMYERDMLQKQLRELQVKAIEMQTKVCSYGYSPMLQRAVCKTCCMVHAAEGVSENGA